MIRSIAAATPRLFIVDILFECVKPGTQAGASGTSPCTFRTRSQPLERISVVSKKLVPDRLSFAQKTSREGAVSAIRLII
jgi:hypothetical protein